MFNASDIREHAEVVGKDGRHVGTVDRVEGDRIKLTKADSKQPGHAGHHHFIDLKLVEAVRGNRVQLSVASTAAISDEEEQSGRSVQ